MFIMCRINIYLYLQAENKQNPNLVYLIHNNKKGKYNMVCVYQQCMATLVTKKNKQISN